MYAFTFMVKNRYKDAGFELPVLPFQMLRDFLNINLVVIIHKIIAPGLEPILVVDSE